MTSDWRILIETRKWDALDDFWRHDAPQEVCAEILAALGELVPLVERINGTERKLEHALPHEVPPDLAYAAKILCMGELEANALGDAFTPTHLTQWSELFLQVQGVCAELAALPEVTDGSADMSRAGHAKEASELLAYIPAILEAMLYSGEEDDKEPDEVGRQLQEHIATAAIYAFAAGRHFQLAAGKEHEPDALRGQKVLSSARGGGEKRRGQTEDRTDKVLTEMSRLIGGGHSISNAAKIAAKGDVGISSEANRKLWNRHKLRN